MSDETAATPLTINVLAQAIRVTDGQHELGAGSLAQAVLEHLAGQGWFLARRDVCSQSGGCGG